ncbi:MAG: UxaA family hydrolase [Gracilibacteraceae bacterium]|jgi:altronate dehydratase small subunit|nr:UxaA family hydrolase [Gracilibacteraceae bacterium]
MNHRAVVIHPADNVATAVADLSAGENVSCFVGREVSACLLQDDIPLGHKFALTPLRVGEAVIKYGETIGAATAPIKVGTHVHVHNVESRRGRGDRSEYEEGEG